MLAGRGQDDPSRAVRLRRNAGRFQCAQARVHAGRDRGSAGRACGAPSGAPARRQSLQAVRRSGAPARSQERAERHRAAGPGARRGVHAMLRAGHRGGAGTTRREIGARGAEGSRHPDLGEFRHPAFRPPRHRAGTRLAPLARRRAGRAGFQGRDLAAARALGTLFVAITAENRIPGSGPFAMRDLARLPALIDRIRSRPARRPRAAQRRG